MILAAEVVREAWRDRWLAVGPLSVLVVGPIMGGAHRLALGGGDKAALDVGLLAVWALATLLSVVLGLSALRARPDLVFALVRPISRTRFLAERFAGACGALALQVAALHLGLVLAALALGIGPPAALLPAALLVWLEACVVTALTGLFAQILAPVPAGSCAAALVVVGHLADEYAGVAAEGGVPPALARAVALLVPDLDRFDAQALVVHGLSPGGVHLALTALYGTAWCAALVLLATLALSRRDLP